jgi:hypothetical protein
MVPSGMSCPKLRPGKPPTTPPGSLHPIARHRMSSLPKCTHTLQGGCEHRTLRMPRRVNRGSEQRPETVGGAAVLIRVPLT